MWECRRVRPHLVGESPRELGQNCLGGRDYKVLRVGPEMMTELRVNPGGAGALWVDPGTQGVS